MFGDGVKFQYTRQDGSVVNEDFTGKSVKNYYLDMSGGKYEVEGDVIGWVQAAALDLLVRRRSVPRRALGWRQQRWRDPGRRQLPHTREGRAHRSQRDQQHHPRL